MSFKPEDNFPNSPAYRGLQPLRISAGWAVGWSALYTDSKSGLPSPTVQRWPLALASPGRWR